MLNITEKINNLIKEIEIKKGLSWVEVRTYLNEIKNRLGIIVAENQIEVNEINKKVEQSQKGIADLQLQLKLEREKSKRLENDNARLEKEKDSQKQELTKQATDLTNEISSLKKKIAQQEENIKQFPTKVADYENLISQLKKENFGLKNSQNEELEAARKKLTDLLMETNPLRVVDMEEAKAIMTEYLEFAQKEGKSWKELATMAIKTREKIEYEEKQEKWEARVTQVQEIIKKLNTSSNQQLTAQIEIKK